ncbi:type II toxin-antitoxin system VapC family toxin [Gloeobacter morelensis]|uniref:Ribonuclease VapC n=1 Tax=Gloeobacter morelensis MG652769 TaxID=2781736 RepID=A0ABY3PJF0_9CYAN|nr:type II toxin-antitoxin system VapC family toxin [Gloeobacter morelensis]UFP93758.1 type II toxin-antitoxin system VapC family toxin [Gloeobacter morelensis MG652769]
MILVDTNLLVYAHIRSFPQHQEARAWLDEKLNEPIPVGLPWPSLLGFARLVTNPRIFGQPLSTQATWRQIESWLGCPSVWIPQPTARHREVLASLLISAAVQANLVPDAHLAALAIEHGLLLCSTDGDFARFSGLRWENPLR